MKLVWHIVKKDAWQQRYLIVAILVTTGFAAIPIQQFAVATGIAALALVVLSWLLVAAVVHAEGLSGTNEHWLTRPVMPRTLLAAKAIDVFLFIVIPLVLLQIAVLSAAGFSFSSYWPAMMNRTAMIALTWVFPAFGLATITRNWQQLGAGLVCILTLVAGVAVLAGDELRFEYWGVVQNGIVVAAAVFSAMVAVWQYRSRRVRAARFVAAFGLCVCIAGPTQIQSSLYSAARRVAPSAGRLQQGVRVVVDPAREAKSMKHDPMGVDLVMIPLIVDGLAPGLSASISMPREAKVSFAGETSSVVTQMTDDSFATFRFDRTLLRRGDTMQLRVRAYVTIMAGARHFEMPVLNGSLRTQETGSCQSWVTDRLHIHCQRPYEYSSTIRGFLVRGGPRPMHLQVFAENPEPWPLHFEPLPFPLARAWGGLSLRSLDQREEYRETSIVFEVSDVLSRFEQDVVIDIPASARR